MNESIDRYDIENFRRDWHVRTPGDLLERLAYKGVDRDLQAAFLPDWWAADCEDDPGLLMEVEIIVVRVLGLSKLHEIYTKFLVTPVQDL